MSDRRSDSHLQEPFLQETENLLNNRDQLPNVVQSVPAYQPETYPCATSPKDLGEDACSAFMKRVYAQLGLIVMFANTISSIFSISAAVSMIPDDNAVARYNFCDYGNPQDVFVLCPYTTSPVFQTFISLWVVYFAVYFTYKYWATSIYYTNDLRFFVYCDKFNSTLLNRLLIALGVLLTFVSGVGAGQSVAHNGTTDSISPILVFMIVNWYNLYHMAVCQYKVLQNMDMESEEAFSSPIVITTEPLWTVFNLNGMLVQQHVVFQYISDALIVNLLTGSEKHVAAMGNVAQIRLVMKTLDPLQLQK